MSAHEIEDVWVRNHRRPDGGWVTFATYSESGVRMSACAPEAGLTPTQMRVWIITKRDAAKRTPGRRT
jgi:hypothetical protein